MALSLCDASASEFSPSCWRVCSASRFALSSLRSASVSLPEPVSSVFTKFFVKSRRVVRIVLFEPSVEAFDRRVVRALDIDVRAVSILALRPKLLAATAILIPDVAVVESRPVSYTHLTLPTIYSV